VNRLFLAGLYQQALQDRKNGKNDQAMALVDMAAERFPSNLDLQLMAVEWTTEVRQDPALALRRLDALQISAENTRGRIRAGLARASALLAQGNRDGAKAVVQTLQAEFPNNAQVKRRLDELN
jgi:predicted Zn-dependent protease